MTQVRISREAADYIRKETAYLKRLNPSSARSFSQIVKRAREALRTFQGAGNTMHGLQVTGGLTLVVEDYLFDYTRESGIVNILAVRHGRMLQLKPDLNDENDVDLEMEEPTVGTNPKFK